MRHVRWLFFSLLVPFLAASNPSAAYAQPPEEQAKVAAAERFSVQGQVQASAGFLGTITFPNGSTMTMAPVVAQGGPWECKAEGSTGVSKECPIGSWTMCMLTGIAVDNSPRSFECNLSVNQTTWKLTARSIYREGTSSVICRAFCFNVVSK